MCDPVKSKECSSAADKLSTLTGFLGLLWFLVFPLLVKDKQVLADFKVSVFYLCLICFLTCLFLSDKPGKEGKDHLETCRYKHFHRYTCVSIGVLCVLLSIVFYCCGVSFSACILTLIGYVCFLFLFSFSLRLISQVKNQNNNDACSQNNPEIFNHSSHKYMGTPHNCFSKALKLISLPICDCGYWEEKASAKQAKKRHKGG